MGARKLEHMTIAVIYSSLPIRNLPVEKGVYISTLTTYIIKSTLTISMPDHTVSPDPALEFAKALGVEPFVLNNDCGHSLQACRDNGMGKAILDFLSNVQP